MKLKFTVRPSSIRNAKANVRAKIAGVYLTGAMMESATLTILPSAKKAAPVESGALRDSLMVEPVPSMTTSKKTTVRIGVDMRMRRQWANEVRVPHTYAAEIETVGDKPPNPRPFLRPALLYGKHDFVDALRASIYRRLAQKRHSAL